MNLSAEDVKEILDLLDAAHLVELHLETERFTLTFRRTLDGSWTREAQVLSAPNVVSGVVSGAVSDAVSEVGGDAGSGAASDAGGKVVGDVTTGQPASGGGSIPSPQAQPSAVPSVGPSAVSGLCEVRAPLPGTFYRAPSPGAPPFVDVGGHVTGDTVVGIVETMKLMNPVLAGVDGRVVEICVPDANFAAQGTVLVRIEPEAP